MLQVSAKEDEVIRLNMELQQNSELMGALLQRVMQEAYEIKKRLIIGFDEPEQEKKEIICDECKEYPLMCDGHYKTNDEKCRYFIPTPTKGFDEPTAEEE